MKPHKHAELIKANLHRFYVSPNHGVITWKDGRRVGKVAGSIDSSGYLQVKLEGTPVLVHRIIYYLYHNSFPEQIDHIDRNRLNNRISNLRPATNMTNQHNAGMKKNNTSGVTGVHYKNGKWQARIQCNRKRIQLGTFETIEEASKAYQKGKEIYHGKTA